MIVDKGCVLCYHVQPILLIYIYIYIERERERRADWVDNLMYAFPKSDFTRISKWLFALFSIFNGISTIMVYLMSKRSLWKNSSNTIYSIAEGIRGFISFSWVFLSESECNSVTGVRTRFHRACSPALSGIFPSERVIHVIPSRIKIFLRADNPLCRSTVIYHLFLRTG